MMYQQMLISSILLIAVSNKRKLTQVFYVFEMDNVVFTIYIFYKLHPMPSLYTYLLAV